MNVPNFLETRPQCSVDGVKDSKLQAQLQLVTHGAAAVMQPASPQKLQLKLRKSATKPRPFPPSLSHLSSLSAVLAIWQFASKPLTHGIMPNSKLS
jgi:hypothetical protein